MHILNRHWPGLAVVILLAIGLSSCQKEGALPATAANSTLKSDLTVGLPPPLVWWASLGNIPYTDDIPGDVPTLNQYPQGFAINGKGFVCGSLLTTSWITGDYIPDLWQYDTAARAWTKKSPYPGSGGGLIEAINFVIGDNDYIVAHNQTWQYNQPTDKWTQKASLPSVNRMNATAFAIKGKGYMGLGWDEDAPGEGLTEMNDWWEYDPVADRWTQKGTFPGSKREGAAGFAVDGLGYVVSGTHYANGQGNFGHSVWQYDPVADHWTQKGNFPGPGRWEAVAVTGTIGGLDAGFIIGGDDDDVAYNDAWEYNPGKDSWGQLPNIISGARTDAAGFVIGRSLYIANKSVAAFNWTR